MAKSLKLEDYWREHNIENLFRDLTQVLTRRMPPDPAVALVEYLQKKFPKSFKTSTDNVGIVSKKLVDNLKLKSITSPPKDISHSESMTDTESQRSASVQSQAAETVPISVAGSNFADLLKQKTVDSTPMPEFNLKNLVFANRLGQHVIKLAKNIRSDHDIINDELIAPTKSKELTSLATEESPVFIYEDILSGETHEMPTVLQLVKYKQQIHIENDRRVHRQKLAEIANTQREKEQMVYPRTSFESEITEESHRQPSDDTPAKVSSSQQSTSSTLVNNLKAQSKKEEEILDDENIFHPSKQRSRGKAKNKQAQPLSNTLPILGRHTLDFRSSVRPVGSSPLICKVCGNPINSMDTPLVVTAQGIAATPIAQLAKREPPSTAAESESNAVDDWFTASIDESQSQQPITPQLNTTVQPERSGSLTFRRNLFQSIKDNEKDLQAIPTDDEAKPKRTETPKAYDFNMFERSPESKVRSGSSTTKSSPLASQSHTIKNITTSHESAKHLPQSITSRSSTPSSTSAIGVTENHE